VAFGNDWLEADPVFESRTIDGHEAVVIWEGPPEQALGAIVLLTDGQVFGGAYIWAPQGTDVLHAIVDSSLVEASALIPA
jgi:hypothetical protein